MNECRVSLVSVDHHGRGLLNKTPKKGSGSNINVINEKAKGKLTGFTDEKVEVSHKSIVLKNLANKIASSESLNEDYASDNSNESTLSDSALNRTRKRSPKFVSEPNLSVIDAEETPKNTKKAKRLFRSNVLSANNLNNKYRKRTGPVRGTPICASCFDDQASDVSHETSPRITPKKSESKDEGIKIQYLTSTPGVAEAMVFEECSTPYAVSFRRASMSPITKSTQKLSKAMQVVDDISPLRSQTRATSLHIQDLNTTLCEVTPNFTITQEPQKSLTEPFREYLLSRSVLTATPIDLSILNKSSEDENLTDSLMYCLNGNIPSDLTLSISNLAVDRSPLRNVVNIDKNIIDKSPNRKRCANTSSDGSSTSAAKKLVTEKENEFAIRETEL
ncbi:Rho GTPase activating protein, partial [Operophtera brumata]